MQLEARRQDSLCRRYSAPEPVHAVATFTSLKCHPEHHDAAVLLIAVQLPLQDGDEGTGRYWNHVARSY